MQALGKIAILVIAWLVATSSPPLPTAIRVSGGLVEGTVENGLRVFRGIPFAAPPVGDLRWRPPQPVVSWTGIRLANEFENACPQGPLTAGGKFRADIGEDCLYLNVWTPAKSRRARLPVMVWIYGGGFRAGATSIPFYSGEQLAKRGVIVVSIAYRLGVFGFMAPPELSAENRRANGAAASGNYGLLDQIAALRWVKKNIAAFGGNPRKVTIFGESAGGISVSLLAASPLARGLFQRAISESGGSFGPPARGRAYPGENIPTRAAAQAAGIALAQKLGASDIAAMRAMAAAKVMAAARGMQGIGWPILDGWVLPGDQYARYRAGRYNKTPVLIGINSDEGFSFSKAQSAADYVAATHARFGRFADKLLSVYPATPGNWRQSSRDLVRDAAFGWPTWTWAKLQAANGPRVWVYYFDHRPPFTAKSKFAAARGVPHGWEVPYVFGHLGLAKLPWTRDDRSISNAMMTYWTNFAKTGNPNGRTMPHWPAFSVDNEQRMVFGESPHAAVWENQRQLEVLDAYFAWRRGAGGKP